MIESLITSKTRVKILHRLFLNSGSKSYLREMAKELNENTNAIRIELNRFEEAGLITSEFETNKKYFKANTKHPFYESINSILKKNVGIDQIIERITRQIGDLQEAYITGSLAEGINSDKIELLLIGQNLDDDYIKNLVEKAGKLMSREINYLILSGEQRTNFLESKPFLLIWKKDDNQ
ncbi:MAG TPA: winged helix-turn-helix domain-containing protein [Draconibacterium sp.]|nr:winged helix-turn-helix domain-containing protein [Draconibacterium sp.]